MSIQLQNQEFVLHAPKIQLIGGYSEKSIHLGQEIHLSYKEPFLSIQNTVGETFIFRVQQDNIKLMSYENKL